MSTRESKKYQPNPENFIIDQLIREKVLKKKYIIDYIGISRQAFHKWELGKSTPSPHHQEKLSELYFKMFPEVKPNMVNEKASMYGRMITNPQYVELPFISVPARASFIEMAGPEKDYGIHDTYYVIKRPGEDIRGCITMEVDGDSMEPQLRSGDKVLTKPIDRGDWAYMSGGVYAISYANFFVIKRIKNNNISEGFLTLYSDNPAGGELTIPVEQIHYIWRVIRVVDATVH